MGGEDGNGNGINQENIDREAADREQARRERKRITDREYKARKKAERNGDSSTTPTDGETTGGTTEKNTRSKVIGIPIITPDFSNIPAPTEAKAPTKKAQTATKKTTGTDPILVGSVNMVLTLGFGFAAARMGPHWNISEQEATAITEPLTRILERLGFSEAAGQYMDYVALFAAVGVIVVPRVMIEASKGAKKNEPNSKPETRKSEEPNRELNNTSPREFEPVGGNGVKASLSAIY